MKITIDEDVCIKHKMTVQEVLLALAFRMNNSDIVINNMLTREILINKGDYLVTQHWSDVLDDIICASAGVSERTEESLMALAEKIRDCFPKGKMKDRFGRDTPYYYRCNKSEVSKALNRFFTQFGNYPDSEIIDATKRYVAANSRNNYANMRLIKYFILKDALKQGEDGNDHVEQISDLATFLENKEEESTKMTSISDDWLMNARN